MRTLLIVAFLTTFLLIAPSVRAQEISARVTINHQQIEGTSKAVFESLERNLTAFINERQWTNYQYRPYERIQLALNLTVQKYDESQQIIEGALNVSLTRPVFGSSYTTTTFATRDADCKFRYAEFDKLEFRSEMIDNDLTAIIAYYAYLAIGIDMDCMSLKGGTDALQQALTICRNAQSLPLSAAGWKAFDNGKNRYAIVSDWLDGAMEPFRQMQYAYYRQGLDLMSQNTERARANINTAFEFLAKARENKSMSLLPQLFTEYKADEIVNIYRGHITSQEREFLTTLLGRINAAKNATWGKLRS